MRGATGASRVGLSGANKGAKHLHPTCSCNAAQNSSATGFAPVTLRASAFKASRMVFSTRCTSRSRCFSESF